MLYPVMAEPPVEGAVHVTVISSGFGFGLLIARLGALGVPGTLGVVIVDVFDLYENMPYYLIHLFVLDQIYMNYCVTH